MRTVPNIAGPPTQVAINMAPAIIIQLEMIIKLLRVTKIVNCQI